MHTLLVVVDLCLQYDKLTAEEELYNWKKHALKKILVALLSTRYVRFDGYSKI